MKIQQLKKAPFVVIGKEGSTLEGPGFIQRLWEQANSQFNQVQHLAKRDPQGELVGVWGAMSDFSRSFLPWEANFTQGLYLAGVECADEAEAPEGWTKWTVPGYEYICVEVESQETFGETLRDLARREIPLVGAVHEFTCPTSGKNFLYFPIRKY